MAYRSPASAFSEMARYDVYRRLSGDGYLLDCQADILADLNSRFVAPLLPLASAPRRAARLNPLFHILGEPHSMVTQFAAAVHVRELGPMVQSLAGEDAEILNALDMLLTGI